MLEDGSLTDFSTLTAGFGLALCGRLPRVALDDSLLLLLSAFSLCVDICECASSAPWHASLLLIDVCALLPVLEREEERDSGHHNGRQDNYADVETKVGPGRLEVQPEHWVHYF